MPTVQELRQLSPQDLDARVADLKRQFFDLKSKHNTGVLDSTADLGNARKDIARALTVKREKELGITRAKKAAATGKE
jgi:large subunit ribosomal protein L29